MTITLNDIIKTKPPRPPKPLIYGTHGIGKTTFGASCKAPIFILAEDGLSNIDVPHFPVAQTAEDIYSALLVLLREQHDYKTVVLDSADWVQKLIYRDICKGSNVKDIHEIPYGRGPKLSVSVWENILSLLDSLRNKRGIMPLVLAHSKIQRFDNPCSEPYDRYCLDLYDGAAQLLAQWCDVLGFANYKAYTDQADVGFGKKVVRATGTGQRVLYLEERPAFDAKNHYSLPAEIPLTNWSDLAKLIFKQMHEKKENGNGNSIKTTAERNSSSTGEQSAEIYRLSREGSDQLPRDGREGNRPGKDVPSVTQKIRGRKKAPDAATNGTEEANRQPIQAGN